jgi:hypothetical protein
MVEEQNVNHGALITDSVASWNGSGLVALGTADAIQDRTAVTAESATYANVTNAIEASKLAVGPDRLWIADPDDNKLYFFHAKTAAVSTDNRSNAVEILDPDPGYLTGLYTYGDHMIAGTPRGPISFTDDGSPAILGEAMTELPSTANGASGGTLWGWHYQATKLGLFAYRLFEGGAVENPVGPGEGLRGLRFEGPIDGYPTAVRPFKDSLWVAYLNPDGTSYVFRGTYGPETDATGRPEWYSFRKLPSLTCQAIGATGQRDIGATVILGEDDNIAYYDLGLRGREIDDPSYLFDTGGGTWFGTTMMRAAGKLINVRNGRFLTENCNGTNTWRLAVQLDDSGTYVNVGAAVATDGLQTVVPVSGGVPLTTVNGSYLKPRLTQVAASETAPPQIRGFLDITYDERPQTIEEHTFLIVLGKGDYSGPNGEITEYDNLVTLYDRANATARAPQAFRLPGETEGDGDSYGFVTDLSERIDLDGKGTQGIYVTLQQWEVS